MGIKKVWIEPGCIVCCCSEYNCPEVFGIRDDEESAFVKEGVDYSMYEERIKYAAKSCPVEVIKYEEE